MKQRIVWLFNSRRFDRSVSLLVYGRHWRRFFHRDDGRRTWMFSFNRIDARRWYVICCMFGYGCNLYWDGFRELP